MMSPLVLPLIFTALLLMTKGTIIGLCRFYFAGTKKMPYKVLTPGTPQGPTWYASLNRAYINGIESFAVFAPIVLLMSMPGGTPASEMAVSLSWIYFYARVLYSVVYTFTGYHVGISFIWLAAFVPNLLLWLMYWMGR
jgi:uncharacterized MAPEG superfamily protein